MILRSAVSFDLKGVLTIHLLGLKIENAATRSARRRDKQSVENGSVPSLSVDRTEGAAMSQPSTQANEIDVRSLIPAKRHEKIFQLVDELAPGASFVLVNDHDPKPLYYQLEAEHPRQFSWTYLEKGPAVWRVEIGKLLKAA
jgi:uncharacterized protein (DUF2249 family)